MSGKQRQRTPGVTRRCPHCRTTILDSANVCPACRHHLRVGGVGTPAPRESSLPGFTALRVEGVVRHPDPGARAGDVCEYSMTMSIRNDRGEEIARQVVGVGSLVPGEARTFTLAVEVFTSDGEGRTVEPR